MAGLAYFYGGEDGEQTGVDFVEISKVFAMQDTFFLGMISFDIVYLHVLGIRVFTIS